MLVWVRRMVIREDPLCTRYCVAPGDAVCGVVKNDRASAT